MLNYPQHITLCGFGGQGIVLAAVILGTTAVTKGGLYAIQTQSYGSEARGGQCQSELIIDKAPINSPVSASKGLLVALFQEAYEKYISTLDEDGILVIDSDLVTNITRRIDHTMAIPATRIATDLGNRMCANMVVLGFLSESCGIVNKEDLTEIVLKNVPERFKELNRQAVEAGAAYAREHGLYADKQR